MSETITKVGLIDKLNERLYASERGTRGVCQSLVDSVFGIITEQVKDFDNSVSIIRVGTFSKRHKESRMAQNPKTKEPAVVRARNLVAFTTTKQFRQSLVERVKHYETVECMNETK